ncbi:unnamed protein product [Ambrosiozyma monospora]|uniref:Unnamed protein product n=1 Tax=Ambrosiozyma monospora TaxID=43982 RepID=A0ACB5TAK7_AMBMO|nr:unnamed protein product [Ambrosiozyma monospora]
MYNKASIIYLEQTPVAQYRINEIYNQLIRYLALISGRLDIVEHNIQGCHMLETVVSQVNLLVAELQFMGHFSQKVFPAGSKVVEKFPAIPSQLKMVQSNNERLTGLVQKLNSDVRFLVDVANRRLIANNIRNDKSKRGKSLSRKNTWKQPRKDRAPARIYFYSKEGGNVINTACKMIQFSSANYRTIKNFINIAPKFELPPNKKYPNFIKMEIKPATFIKKSSAGLAKDRSVKSQVKHYHNMPPTPNTASTNQSTATAAVQNTLGTPKLLNTNDRASKRFSVFRTGNAGDMELTNDGLDFLAGISTGDNSPFLKKDGEFNKFLDSGSPDSNGKGGSLDVEDTFNPEDEIIRDPANNDLLGASFKALIALLTSEAKPPDYFFISAFFLTYRIFSNGSILLEELITRFDVSDALLASERRRGTLGSKFTSLETKVKARRKLVCKTFQLWLESYWKPKTDYILLAPLINFFNEAVVDYMPVEAYKLLETASRLVDLTKVAKETSVQNVIAARQHSIYIYEQH